MNKGKITPDLHNRSDADSGHNQSSNEEIDLSGLWNIILNKKKLFISIIFLTTLVSLAYAITLTPIYRAEALLAVVEKEANVGNGFASQYGGLAALTGVNFESGGDIEIAIATLKSRNFTYKFIQEENLLSILFAQSWDNNLNKWKNDEEQPTLWDAYEIFDKIRHLNRDPKTGIVSLAIDWEDPVIASEWVNKLIARINKKLREEAILNSEKRISYLEKELQKTSILEIKDAIYGLIESQAKIKMLASTQEEYAFRVIDRAVIPEQKINSRRTIVILGFVIGIFLGLISVLLTYYNRRK